VGFSFVYTGGKQEAKMREHFIILKKHEDLLTAQRLALQEYEKFFKQFHAHISNSTHVILRERYAHEGKVAYLIRVEFTEDTTPANLDTMQHWTKENIKSDLERREWMEPITGVPVYRDF
jgi:hypothetical protein